MIIWWHFPLICTLLATLAVIWTGFFCNLDYRGFMAAGLAFASAAVCSAVWVIAFLLKVFA